VPDRTQPGVEVDAELWAKFREDVDRRRGGVRGHLRNELENALRAYIHGGDATPADIDERLQRIEAAVGAAGADGGAPTLSEQSAPHTHTGDGKVTLASDGEKPHDKAPKAKKIAYLAACVRDREDWLDAAASELPDVDPEQLPAAAFDNKIARARFVDDETDLTDDRSVPESYLRLVGEDERNRLQRYVNDEELPGPMPINAIDKATLRDVIKAEYGFRRDTAKEYVEGLRDHFGLVEHPDDPELFVSTSMREEIIEENASDRLEEL